MSSDHEIRSMGCLNCKVCGVSGVSTYQGLSDRLFAAPGLWNLRKCPNAECGLMWLDPMPMEEDIHKAYQTYYTHGEKSRTKGRIGEIVTYIQKNILLLLLRLTPLYQERKDFNQMYLHKMKPGKLLEVGCGDGTKLTHLTTLGWAVEGQEVDRISAARAAKTGIKVHVGSLENLNLPDASYDAIVMKHVIEHMHEPVKLLVECRRLLSPHGTLIAVTPNTRSFGHRIFKSYWRGLEPPRHIFLYCQNNLRRIAQNAGFENPLTFTTAANAHHFALDSLKIIYGHMKLRPSIKILCCFGSILFLFMARIVHTFNKDSGEECIMMLRKSE